MSESTRISEDAAEAAAHELRENDEKTARASECSPPVPVRIRDRIRELRRVRAGDLVPNRKNWRRHPQEQVDALRGLLSEIGYADALLTRELPNGQLQIIDGHLRAATTPDCLVPALVLDVSEAEADKILATLDPLATLAKSDAEQLKALLQTVTTDSEAVEGLLRQTAGDRVWQSLHPNELRDLEVPTERADELKKKWSTDTGQLWCAASHRIICGDCTDPSMVARLWDSAESRFRMIFADPPYGVAYGEKTEWTKRHGGGRSRRSIANDSLKPADLQKLFTDALTIARQHAVAGAAIYATVPSVFLKYFIEGLEDGGFGYRHCLIWLKQSLVLGRSDYHYRHEPILYGWLGNGPHYFTEDRTHDSILEVDRPFVSDSHPTMKPVELVAELIRNSSRSGEVIYDPFCGSGPTILAAHQLGRIGFGCEIDPGYLAVTLERLSLLGLRPELVSA
jgi:DNA modification methylase